MESSGVEARTGREHVDQSAERDAVVPVAHEVVDCHLLRLELQVDPREQPHRRRRAALVCGTRELKSSEAK